MGLKVWSVLTAGTAITGGALAVDERTLVPMSLVIGAVVMACTLTWKAAMFLHGMNHQVRHLRDRIDHLERRQGGGGVEKLR